MICALIVLAVFSAAVALSFIEDEPACDDTSLSCLYGG